MRNSDFHIVIRNSKGILRCANSYLDHWSQFAHDYGDKAYTAVTPAKGGFKRLMGRIDLKFKV
jgi:hypothetical protein